jgi:membrane-associated phospholipid phosphatase
MDIFSNLIYFDSRFAKGLVSVRSLFWDDFFFLFTNLGSWQVVTGLFILISFIFILYRKKDLIFPLFVSIFGSGIMVVIIKYLVDRARPGGDISLYSEQLPSFPSAHAALIFALFGFLIYCAWRLHFRSSFKLSIITKIIATFTFSLIIILVGFSRLYLGVHFLSDVIAGYLTGLVWVLIAMYISRKEFLSHRRF